MNPNNLFSGYSYKEKVRFLAFREQLQEEERLDRISGKGEVYDHE
jgi:hypothetical protein